GGDVQIELAASAVAPPPRTSTTRTVVVPTTPKPTPTPKATQTSAPLDLPFKVGEQLNYRVYLGKATTPIGSLNFEIKTRGRFFNRDGLQIIASAETSG